VTRNRSVLFPYLVPVAVGTVLRLFGLTRQSFWIDEILTLRAASFGEPFRFADVLANPQGPLPHLLLRGWAAVFGDGDLALRLWCAFAGILCLGLAAVTFRRIWPRATVAGVWLVALSPFQVWYSQEVRNYIFLMAAALLVAHTLFRALDRPGAGRWLLHAAALAVALLCNLSALFLLPALATGLLLARPRALRGWLPAALLALALAWPWVQTELAGHVAWEGVGNGANLTLRGTDTFRLVALPYTAVVFLGGYGLGPALRTVHAGLARGDWLPLVPGLILLATGIAGCLGGLWNRRRDERVRILFWWTVIPPVLVSVLALLGWKAYNARYLAATQPVLLLLVAIGWSEVRSASRTRALLYGLCLVAAMAVGWERQTFRQDYAKEDFRGAAHFLDTHAKPGDLILQQGVNGPLLRYYGGRVPVTTFFPVYSREADGGRSKLNALVGGSNRVWWVGSRLWYEDPDRRLLRWIMEEGAFVDSWRGAGVEVRGYRLAGEGR